MLGSSIQTVEHQQHSAPVSLFGWQICDENKVAKDFFLYWPQFKILLRVRCVEYEYNLHFKPGMSQHRWLSLVVNRGFWYKETYWWQDKGARDRVVILSAKYSVWSIRTCSVWFWYSNCLVEVKVQARFKLYFGGSMHLS